MTKLDSDGRTPAYKSTCPKGGVSRSKESFVVNQTLFFQIKLEDLATKI